MKKTNTLDVSHGIVHIRSENGHRRGYRDLFVRLLECVPETGPIRGKRFLRLLRAPFVLIATIDCDYVGSLALMFLRFLLRKPTSALLLRPQTCFIGGWKFRAKRIALYIVKSLPRQKILTIIPFSIRPDFSEIATDWIYDPEIWDLSARGINKIPETALSRHVRELAADRPILVVLGAIGLSKGIAQLRDLVTQTPGYDIDLCIVIAGRVSPEAQVLVKKIAALGVYVEDRLLSDDEMLSLYGIASAAWCCYDPTYDQASGIFGRAIQTGVMPIVRKHSALEALSIELQVPTIIFGELKFREMASQLADRERPAIKEVVAVVELLDKIVERQ